ncbi:MAG: serine/threonine-protein kinase [Longimicrobiales bacterium]
MRSSLADRYTVEHELGAGSMAVVFLASDLKHRRSVALKVLRPEIAGAAGADRFLREIELAAQLTHPHILPLHDSGSIDGLLYYVMPHVEGESLRQRMRREPRMSREEALRIAGEVASALDYAHRRGVVHRDIKPENILLHEGAALVADFGIGKAVSGNLNIDLTATGIVIGTPAYMSPEQAVGETAIDGRSDQYSLGCVVYEMLAGKPPFIAATAPATIALRITSSAPRLDAVTLDVPESVADAVATALARESSDRFATTAEFARALETSEPAGYGVSKTATGVNGRLAAAAPQKRSRARAVAALATVLVVGSLSALIDLRPDEPPPNPLTKSSDTTSVDSAGPPRPANERPAPRRGGGAGRAGQPALGPAGADPVSEAAKADSQMIAAVDAVFRVMAARDTVALAAASSSFLPGAKSALIRFMKREYQNITWGRQARHRALPDGASAFDLLIRFEMPPRQAAAPPEVHRVIFDRSTGPWRIRSLERIQ